VADRAEVQGSAVSRIITQSLNASSKLMR